MKIIKTGKKIRIFGDDLKTYNEIPKGVYKIAFSKFEGFFLEEQKDIEITETKLYGSHEVRLEKMLKRYDNFNRNMGVLLSGDKGMGKSLFSKALCKKIKEEKDLPIILVDMYIPGIASFINEIEQEVAIMFDEFDKTFSKGGDMDPQEEMLTVFDGFSNGKKLFIITCNELYNLNSYLVNRTGRFHYHLRFNYPTAIEIKKYLMDKLILKDQKEIKEIIDFSLKTKINYDSLRSIVFELNNGESFRDAIKDLNIMNLENEIYEIKAYSNDKFIASTRKRIDIFGNSEEIDFYHNLLNYNIEMNLKEMETNELDGSFVIGEESLFVKVFDDDYERAENNENKIEINKVVIKKNKSRELNFIL